MPEVSVFHMFLDGMPVEYFQTADHGAGKLVAFETVDVDDFGNIGRFNVLCQCIAYFIRVWAQFAIVDDSCRGKCGDQ